MADLAPVLALLYGYNLGYLRETLEHPPAGTTVDGRIECPTELSCRTPALPLAGAARYDATFTRLAAPGGDDPRWSSTAAVLHGMVGAAEPGGRAVWSQLLAGDGFDAGGYEAIVDLYGRGQPTDVVAVADELTKRGEISRVGGHGYLHTLISSVPTAANAGYYA